jgi:hypothetical protein
LNVCCASSWRWVRMWSPTGKPETPASTPVGRNPEQAPRSRPGLGSKGRDRRQASPQPKKRASTACFLSHAQLILRSNKKPAMRARSCDHTLLQVRREPIAPTPSLYSSHSRNPRVATRYSPTRFIPHAAPAGIFPELDCFHALGIKRYT